MSLITKIQSVAITVAAGATTGTASISSVNTSLSAVFYNGSNYAANVANASEVMGGVVLTNATTVTGNRNTSDASNALTLYATVVTFASTAIKSIQAGSTAMTTSQASNTSTITGVTTANSGILYNGCITALTGTVQAQFMTAAVLTNATTVTVSRGSASGAMTVYWTVIEFNSGILHSNTQAGNVLVSSSTPATTTITSVTAANSMLFWGGQTSASTGSSAWCNATAMTLTNATTVTATMDNSPVSGTTAYFTVIEFKSTDIKSVNRATTTIASGNSLTDTTISAVVLANTLPNFLGSTTSATASFQTSWIFPKITLTSTTNARVSTNSVTSGNTDLVGWEAIEFVPFIPAPYFYDLIGGM